MDSYTFENADDDFVFVSLSEPAPFRQASLESTDDEGCSRRSRSRGRTDSRLRKQKQQAAEIERSGSTVLLVSNLRDACHDAFLARLAQEVPGGRLRGVHVAPEHSFGFLEFTDLESMHDALRRLNDCEINGQTISLSRCAAVTPGRNPRALDDEQPCDTLALKPMPLDLTMPRLTAELQRLPGLAPIEVYFHVSPIGTFSGTVILRFATLEAAQRAHALFNGLKMLGRQVRAEYKRADSRATPRPYRPICRETETLFAKLTDFKSSAGQSLVLTTKMMHQPIREQLVAMVASLGLRAVADGELPTTQLTILRPIDERSRASSMDRTPSVSRTPSIVASRTPLGPDGTRGFRPAGAMSAAAAARDPDSGIRSAALARTHTAATTVTIQDHRTSSGTWNRSRRLTGTS